MGRTASAAPKTGKASTKGKAAEAAPEVVQAAKVNLERQNERPARKPRQVPPGTMSGDAKLLEANSDNHTITDEQRQGDRRADDQVLRDKFAQMTAQLQGGQGPKVDPKEEEFKRRLAELQAEYGVKVDVKVKAARADKVQQNGVTRPAPASLCGRIWATADAISLAHHGVCAVASLREHADMKNVNEHTIKTQYAKWRQFHGIKGRLPTIPAHAIQQVQGVYPEAEHNVVNKTDAPTEGEPETE